MNHQNLGCWLPPWCDSPVSRCFQANAQAPLQNAALMTRITQMRLPEAWGRLTMDELNMIGGDVIQHPPYRVCINCEVFFFSKPQTRSNPEICDQSCYAAIVWGQVCQPLWLDSAACHADGRWTWLYDIATIVVMKQGYFMNSMTCMLGRLGRVEISWGRVGENFAESWQKD